MRQAKLAIVVALVALLAPSIAQSNERFYYLKPAQLDLTVLLAPPPDVASAMARSEQAQVAAAVAGRSASQLLQAQESSVRTVFFYAPSVGPGFTPERLPITATFFARIGSDVKNVIDDAKDYWSRPRPGTSPPKEGRGSYPSGHAAFAAASAIVLAQLIPARRDAIFTQARTFAEDRILLGLHYPSDVAAGWTSGTLAVYAMTHDAAFDRDFAAAKAELRRANF